MHFLLFYFLKTPVLAAAPDIPHFSPNCLILTQYFIHYLPVFPVVFSFLCNTTRHFYPTVLVFFILLVCFTYIFYYLIINQTTMYLLLPIYRSIIIHLFPRLVLCCRFCYNPISFYFYIFIIIFFLPHLSSLQLQTSILHRGYLFFKPIFY